MTHAIIETNAAPGAIGPYSQAISAGNFLFTSGQIAIDPETGLMNSEPDVKAQAQQVLKNLFAVIRAGGFDPTDVVKTTIFLKEMSHFTEVNEVYAEAFADHRPARSTVAVSALPKGALVEIEAICVKR